MRKRGLYVPRAVFLKFVQHIPNKQIFLEVKIRLAVKGLFRCLYAKLAAASADLTLATAISELYGVLFETSLSNSTMFLLNSVACD